MPDATLRPLSFGELIDQSFTLYRQLFVPLVLVQLICTGLLRPMQIYLVSSGQQVSVTYFLVLLALFVLSALASAAVALVISENYLGRRLDAIPALKLALPKLGKVLALSLAVGLVMTGSAIPAAGALIGGFAFLTPALTGGQIAPDIGLGVAMILGGFVLMLLPLAVFAGLAIATPALVLEDLGAGAALRRSWTLTRGARLRVIGLLLVTGLLVMIPVMGITLLVAAFGGTSVMSPTGASGATLWTMVASSAASLVLTPIVYCVMTLLYYDFRVRKEAFDLQILADSLAA